MLKKEIIDIFKDWNPKIIKIFKSLFVEKKGPDGYYYERKDKYEKIYCPNRLFKTIQFIADVREQIQSNL